MIRLAANKNNNKKTSNDENEVETEDIFGFTLGSDLPEKGNKEGELELVGSRGKQDGSYTALTKELAIKYMALTDTRFAVSGAMAYQTITGVTGLEDRNKVSPQSLGFEVKHRLLDRAKAPFGLAVSARPSWVRSDEMSGMPVSQFETAFALITDKELVKDWLFGAINLLYGFAVSRVLETGERNMSPRLELQRLHLGRCVRGSFWAQRLVTCGLTRDWAWTALQAKRSISVLQLLRS